MMKFEKGDYRIGNYLGYFIEGKVIGIFRVICVTTRDSLPLVCLWIHRDYVNHWTVGNNYKSIAVVDVLPYKCIRMNGVDMEVTEVKVITKKEAMARVL